MSTAQAKGEDALVTRTAIEEAYETIRDSVTHTPLQFDRYLSEKYDCQVYLKREDLQKVRSFKLRGAYYAIKNRPFREVARGVVCASAGNHAQGVAYTCQEMKIPGVIFMPTPTPNQKISQVQFFGGDHIEVRLIGDTFDEAAAAAKEYAAAQQLPFIDPFNHPDIIAGQGTLAIEMMQDAAKQQLEIDYVLAAVGGGGLISGIATYVKATSPTTKILGIEPTGAQSMRRALDEGHPVHLPTIDKFVDGAAVQEVGTLTFSHTEAYVDHMYAVDEGQVCTTILELYSKQAIVAEPAGALTVAVLDQLKEKIKGKTIVCVISGGNNDISRMEEIDERSLIYQGLKHYFLVNFPQRPGALREFVTDILGPEDDITRFEYTKKVNRGTGPVVIGIQLKQREAIHPLRQNIARFDPNFIDLSENQSLYTLLV